MANLQPARDPGRDSPLPDAASLSRRELLALTAAATLAAASPLEAENPMPTTPEPAAARKVLRPAAVAFDVVETLFGHEPIGARLKTAGLPAVLWKEWFARLIRDAFALDATGVFRPFPEVARATLEVLLAENGVRPEAETVAAVLAGFAELPAHADVRPAFQRLRDERVPIFALTNGSAGLTGKLLEKAGLDAFVERVISIEEIKRWKPNREVYLHAAKVAGVPASRLALVAVHSWDIHGAHRAGLVTGWASRLERHFHPLMGPADVRGASLGEVVRALLALPRADS
jgi:2-haloacid dehalogenase